MVNNINSKHRLCFEDCNANGKIIFERAYLGYVGTVVHA